jgi:HAE1 family hydrophobic/amphiphilic exporter-1
MVNFFINRPIFATVLAILMVLVGGICLFVLPVSLYPDIVPPQVQVTATYTGADATTVADSVTTPIEQKVNGVKGMIYMSSNSTAAGVSKITVTFDVGYSQDIAAIDVQNKVDTAKPSLPPEVTQIGVESKKTTTNMVCVVSLFSPNETYDANFLDNYGQINVVDVMRRIKGVSDVNIFGRKYAMRIWLDADRMANYFITPDEVVAAIKSENRQAAAGKIGAPPVPLGQTYEYPVTAQGRLKSPEEFQNIVVRARPDGSKVLMRDIARVELGSESYDQAGFLSGKPAATIPIYQQSDANALQIVKSVRNEMDRLAQSFPPDLEYRIAFDTTKYVEENISEVEHTLIEAFMLVLIVVFVFLQNVRATVIPMIAIPVSLVGTFALMAVFGFSINTLTLMGLVLAIGLVVDDAIIVVESVEKNLERGMNPLEAAQKAMALITAPIVTITLVLAAVFVPVAFIPGMTGRLYNQFALTIVFSFLLSAVNSLTFSPAMCRLFLKHSHGETRKPPLTRPVLAFLGAVLAYAFLGHFVPENLPAWLRLAGPAIAGAFALVLLSAPLNALAVAFFNLFNQGMRWLETSYDSVLEFTAKKWCTIVIPSLALLALTAFLLWERPKGFIPTEDQGYLILTIQLPDGTTLEPSQALMQRVERLVLDTEGVVDTVRFDGFNPLTQLNQPNCGAIYVILAPWEERKSPELRARGLVPMLRAKLSAEIQEGLVLLFEPPPIQGLGATGGFEFQLEDRSGQGPNALAGVVDQFLAEARRADDSGRPAYPELIGLYTPYSVNVPQLRFDLDRLKATTLEVPVANVFQTLQVYLGGLYVNDFNLYGKTWRVYVQADGNQRRQPEDINRLRVFNRRGERVPLAALGRVERTVGPIDVPHYNLFNSAKISGSPAPGYSSGQAVAAMERIARKILPDGFGYEWTGVTFQELKAGNLATVIFALSVVCVFLFMSALYESWIRPAVIILTVPLATFGAMVGLWLFQMPLDVFGQIGLVMLIGLETKNAILIIETAVDLRKKEGKSILESARLASRERLRPILMTSFAFVMGVLPMARATGAGAYSRNSLGVVIVFGILVSTVLGRFVIPIYYVLGERIGDWIAHRTRATPSHSALEPATHHALSPTPSPESA